MGVGPPWATRSRSQAGRLGGGSPPVGGVGLLPAFMLGVAATAWRVDGVLRGLHRGLRIWLRGRLTRVPTVGRTPKDAGKRRVPSGGTTAQAICADSASHVAMTIETLWRFVAVCA